MKGISIKQSVFVYILITFSVFIIAFVSYNKMNRSILKGKWKKNSSAKISYWVKDGKRFPLTKG